MRIIRDTTKLYSTTELLEEYDPKFAVEQRGGVVVLAMKARNVTMEVAALSEVCRDRLVKIFHDEPETISWIHSFGAGDTLLDVGANIGTYSIFAAKLKRVRCLAFEPMVENFRALLMNVSLNQLNDVVTCYPYGVYERELKSRIYMSQPFNTGHALNSVEKNVNYSLGPHMQRISHEVYLTTLDGIDFDRGGPYHLKIDVDGQELSVIKGAVNTLGHLEKRRIFEKDGD
jgi:FkbM family methyltransferase